MLTTTHLQILTTLFSGTRARLERTRDESGSVTLEQVVIALALFLVATAVVAIITNAVMSRANQIS